ncbi:lantibiotic dehydratase [Streptomyces sp. ISL-86]|uniref:lantibiotic dehydratase n=1 Tax=Streptomyces sp. ISL-86 TaxID=2819187 RepID=UPI001BE605F9|nr:lantibiotic dehydratase [Streptomyces sp. ISL-86]MBT2454187.1 lantibiotic dehydratase [Streptomyces sp. ISL-86]
MITQPMVPQRPTRRDPAPGPRTTLRPAVSDWTVHRINQLPVEALDLALAHTSQSLQQETTLEQRLKEQSGPLADTLHLVIPALDDAPDIRRSALELRRAVHNRRPAKVTAAAVRALSERLDGAAGSLMAHWLDGMEELVALRTATDARYATETTHASQRLRAVLADHRLGQGLAHASPHLLSHLSAKPLEPSSKAARSVLGYLSRAALKTSPFARLTALALDGRHADGAGHTYPDQQHVRSWVDTLVRDERFAQAFQVEPNQSVRQVSGRPYLLVPSYGGPGEAAWRTDTLADAALYGTLLDELTSWPRMTIADCLLRIAGEDPFGCFLRLLDTGWLCPVLPWEAGEAQPLLAIARSLQHVGHPAARRTAGLLEQLEEAAVGLHSLPGGERARTIDQLVSRVRSVPEGDPQPAVRYAVYEDAVSDVPLSLKAPLVREDLAELGELIRPHIFRSHVYDWLRDEFVALYGPGGHCEDVFTFLWTVAAAPNFEGKFFQALQLDHRASGRPTERAWLPVSASSAPPTVAAFYQVAAGSVEDIRAGRHQTIVNQYNSGVGGLVARFRRQLDAPDDLDRGLTPQLRDWIADLFPQADPRQVTLSGDVNGMHYAADGVLPRLSWPSEPSRRGEPADSAAPALGHDPVSETLVLLDQEGRTLAPVYLGVVPQHLVPGVARLLLCLADPWVNGSRMCCTQSPVDVPPPPVGGEMERLPRTTHHRLVLGRRTWRFAPATLPRPTAGESAPAFFRRMHQWRSSHGIPDEVYLSIESSSPPGGVNPASGKPFWLSFRSPHALWAAVHHVEKAPQASAIRLAEAHPDLPSYWLRDGLGGRRAAEHVSLLRWERPTPGNHARAGMEVG